MKHHAHQILHLPFVRSLLPSSATRGWFYALVLLTVLVGCGRRQELVTEYGKVVGDQGGTSVNGTSVLFEMFRENGFRVKRYRKISPRLNRYNTIVWFPNDQGCPSSEAIDALENWLTEGYLRTLIYVGRDYDAEVDLFQHLLGDGSQDREEIYRLLAEARLRQDQRRRRMDGDEERQKCDWFELSPLLRRKATKMSGPWAENLNGQSANIELSTWLRPSPQVWEDPERVVSTLLAADEQDFAYSIENQDDTGKIIVISNGSFLLNFGLVNHANRRIANALIEQCRDYPAVVFLESGPNGIVVSDKDSLNHNSWAWIAQPPLRYIVPHFLLCGVLFCFVFFPIFGRPREFGNGSNASFRSHIAAMGKLLQRTEQSQQAMDNIQHYKQNVSRDPNPSKQT